MSLAVLGVLAATGNFCQARFSVDHDLFSTPEFIVRNDTLRYMPESQVHSYIQSVRHLTDLEVEILKFRNDTYLCTIPILKDQDLVTEDSQELAKWDENQLLEAQEAAIKMLEPMAKKCFYYSKDWWTYSFCFGKDIRQFHLEEAFYLTYQFPEPGTDAMSFILGKFARKPNGDFIYDAEVKTEGDTNYLSYTIGQGTVCDLTKEDRSIEVQFYCSPDILQDTISWIKEVKSCKYQIAVKTAKICGIPVFAPPEKIEPRQIDCQRVLGPSDIRVWENAQKLAVAEKLREQAKEAELSKTKTTAAKEQIIVPTTASDQAKLNAGGLAANQVADTTTATTTNPPPPAAAAAKSLADVIYNDQDFSNFGPMTQIQLDPQDSTGMNLLSYLDDTQHTLKLLIKKVSNMIRQGEFKKANGAPIMAESEFQAVMELLDLDGKRILHVRIELSKGDLAIRILPIEDKSDYYYDDDSDDDNDDQDELDPENADYGKSVYGDLPDLYEDPYHPNRPTTEDDDGLKSSPGDTVSTDGLKLVGDTLSTDGEISAETAFSADAETKEDEQQEPEDGDEDDGDGDGIDDGDGDDDVNFVNVDPSYTSTLTIYSTVTQEESISTTSVEKASEEKAPETTVVNPDFSHGDEL